MPLRYCTFSLFLPLDHTCIAVDDHSPAAKVIWRKHGKCNYLHSWFCKADHCWMGKDTETGRHRATQICKGSFGPSASTPRGEKSHNMPRSERCLQWMRSTGVFTPRLSSSFMKHQTTPRSFGLHTKDKNPEVPLRIVPPYLLMEIEEIIHN